MYQCIRQSAPSVTPSQGEYMLHTCTLFKSICLDVDINMNNKLINVKVLHFCIISIMQEMSSTVFLRGGCLNEVQGRGQGITVTRGQGAAEL